MDRLIELSINVVFGAIALAGTLILMIGIAGLFFPDFVEGFTGPPAWRDGNDSSQFDGYQGGNCSNNPSLSHC